MLAYLEKFNKLSKELRDKVSSPAALAVLDELERKYGLALAAMVIRVVVKDIKLADLANYFAQEEKLNTVKSEQLASELKNRLFFNLLKYLEQPETVAAQPIQTPIFKREERERTRGINGSLVKGASFFFSAEDETEIRELAKKINGYSISTAIAEQIDALLEIIINKTKINFGSADLADRFKQILRIYLRGIRDRIETKQTMMKSFLAGGLSFDNESADNVLAVVDESSKNLSQEIISQPPARIKTPELEQEVVASLERIGARDFEYDLATLAKRGQIKREAVAARATKIDTSQEITPPPPAIIKSVAPPVKPTPPPPSRSPEREKIKPLKSQISLKDEMTPKIKPLIRLAVEPESKVRVEDVKFVPRVMGPIDELKFLELTNWRRLDKEPVKIAEKIKEKIKLLEEESYAKRLEGIKAWRLSPVNRLYLAMGQASISNNQPVDVIIEERKKQGEEYLTSQEFEAIMDLNRELRF